MEHRERSDGKVSSLRRQPRAPAGLSIVHRCAGTMEFILEGSGCGRASLLSRRSGPCPDHVNCSTPFHLSGKFHIGYSPDPWLLAEYLPHFEKKLSRDRPGILRLAPRFASGGHFPLSRLCSRKLRTLRSFSSLNAAPDAEDGGVRFADAGGFGLFRTIEQSLQVPVEWLFFSHSYFLQKMALWMLCDLETTHCAHFVERAKSNKGG